MAKKTEKGATKSLVFSFAADQTLALAIGSVVEEEQEKIRGLSQSDVLRTLVLEAVRARGKKVS